jgi:hypothetical protein
MNVPDHFAGKRGKCPGCGVSILIAMPSEQIIMDEQNMPPTQTEPSAMPSRPMKNTKKYGASKQEPFRQRPLLITSPNKRKNIVVTVVITAIVAAAVIVVFGGGALVVVPAIVRSHMNANEVAAESSCIAYAEAQEIYRRTDYDGDGVKEYAQSIRGANSLIDKVMGDNAIGLLDKSFGAAEGDPGKAIPKSGYCFKILKAQGPEATGGRRSYVDSKGNMTLGYGLLAYPHIYGNDSGRFTFVMNNNGTIYKKDLGKNTHDSVRQMEEFNPDSTWSAWPLDELQRERREKNQGK